jgi:hypothetical protein
MRRPDAPSDPAWYRVALRSWRSGTGALPTTRAGAEIAVVITMVGWRLGTLVQIIPAIPAALDRSTRPWLSALLLAVVVVESGVILTWVGRHRGYTSLRWATGETALVLACLLLEPWYVP